MARLLAGFFALYLITTAYAGPFGSHENILVVDEIYEGRNLSLYFAEEGNIKSCAICAIIFFLLYFR